MKRLLFLVILPLAAGFLLFHYVGDTMQVTSSKHITDIKTVKQFDEIIQKGEGFSIVLYYGSTDEESKKAGETVSAAAEKYHESIKFASINCDRVRDIAKRFSIELRQLPRFQFFRDGVAFGSPIPYTGDDSLERMIKRYQR